MNEYSPTRLKDPPYFWVGYAADFDQEIIDLIIPPAPLIEVDSTDIDE